MKRRYHARTVSCDPTGASYYWSVWRRPTPADKAKGYTNGTMILSLTNQENQTDAERREIARLCARVLNEREG
jgi:hypothetical protein